MTKEEKIQKLREEWKNVPSITSDNEDIKIRRKIIEVRAKMLSWGTKSSDPTDPEFWN